MSRASMSGPSWGEFSAVMSELSRRLGMLEGGGHDDAAKARAKPPEAAEIHAALRALTSAGHKQRLAEQWYRNNPTNANAYALHDSWIALRKAIDALVAIPSQSEWVGLADGSLPSVPKGTDHA